MSGDAPVNADAVSWPDPYLAQSCGTDQLVAGVGAIRPAGWSAGYQVLSNRRNPGGYRPSRAVNDTSLLLQFDPFAWTSPRILP